MHSITYRFSISKLAIGLLSISFAFFGCKKENTNFPPPTIDLVSGSGFVSSDTILNIGEAFKIGVIANNPEVNLTNFIIRVEGDMTETYLDSGMNTPILNFERTIIKGISESEKWTFIIRDRDGKSSEKSLVITKDTLSSYGNIQYFPNIELGAQDNLAGSFYSLSEDSVFNLASAFSNQSTIDLCYFYDIIEIDENTIASPGANIHESIFPGASGINNWAVRRTTRFKIANISESDFMNATNDSLLLIAYGQSEGKRKAKNIHTGNIFSFRNEDGKLGLFKVNSLVGTDEGTINISIKVQE